MTRFHSTLHKPFAVWCRLRFSIMLTVVLAAFTGMVHAATLMYGLAGLSKVSSGITPLANGCIFWHGACNRLVANQWAHNVMLAPSPPNARSSLPFPCGLREYVEGALRPAAMTDLAAHLQR